MSEMVDVVIVGAGPYGLSIAAYLQQKKVKLSHLWYAHADLA